MSHFKKEYETWKEPMLVDRWIVDTKCFLGNCTVTCGRTTKADIREKQSSNEKDSM